MNNSHSQHGLKEHGTDLLMKAQGILRKQILFAEAVCVWGSLGAIVAAPASGQISATCSNLHPAGSLYSYANGVGGAQQVGQIYVGTVYHAALWSGSVGSLVDLHPVGAASSVAYALSGSQQAGSAVIGGKYHAAMWSGTATSFMDLNPASATTSEALGIGGSQQVGYIGYGFGRHAALWSGTSDSFVDLHPTGYQYSTAYATSGSNQVGSVQLYDGNTHAAQWSGTANSFVDLGPGWWNSTSVPRSEAGAVGGTNKAGFYQLNNESVIKAALWSGTAFVSLHPDGASASQVVATTDSMQVGFATIGGQDCLGYWRGTAQSFVNFGPLATGFGTGYSNVVLKGIWIDGSVIHLAGDANSQAIYCRIQLHPARLILAGAQTRAEVNILTLTWTNNGVPCVLESSDTPTSGWGMTSAPQTTNAGWVSTIVTNAAPAQYFRLRAN
jgi:hypothetical protein